MSELRDLVLGKGVVVVDIEVGKSFTDKALFQTPEKLIYGVGCTLSDEQGFRDWIGEESVPALVRYLLMFDQVVGFNHQRFDYGVLSGALMREFERGEPHCSRVRKAVGTQWNLSERDPEPGMVAELLRGRTVDIHRDVFDFLSEAGHAMKGRRANLDRISTAMIDVGGGKESSRFEGGAEAPSAWEDRMCLEVIDYCRKDVWLTGAVYVDLKSGKPLKNMDWPNKGINEFSGRVSLRTR